MPQVLSNILDYDMEPYDACVAPRMQPLDDDYTLTIESRLPEKVVQDIARLGVFVKSHPPYDWHMGSFQMCWRDAETGLLNSSTGPRRAGRAAGY
jgi:gamma-glutamyltranspeptidase/glutathione hydrolase